MYKVTKVQADRMYLSLSDGIAVFAETCRNILGDGVPLQDTVKIRKEVWAKYTPPFTPSYQLLYVDGELKQDKMMEVGTTFIDYALFLNDGKEHTVRVDTVVGFRYIEVVE